ncbi:N-acetylglucosamine-6-phosphate deacetylase [Candidatus Bathyarchaeota archaeon]|nr:MAG: N-acetylglucosamine-6-phosphate deacetylase [Candidatus Bathyarchaeota archaeon]
MTIVIKNGRICNPRRVFIGDIEISGSQIKKVGYVDEEGDIVIDASNRLVFPGFIDLHIQGAGGADVLDGNQESLNVISKTCVKFGVTSFLATTVYRPNKDNGHFAAALSANEKGLEGARFLGFHIEGPFISPQKRGMIRLSSICKPSSKVLEDIIDVTGGFLRMMTIAPELEGSLEIIERLVDLSVVASFGHSSASYEETLMGIAAGISHVTHLFNAMNIMHHRSPGPLLAIFESKDVTAQIISDGVHVVPPMVRFAASIMGPERLVLISDGMRAMGLPEGKYVYDGQEFISRGGTARYLDGTLIGTTLGLNQLAKNFMKFTKLSLSEISMVSSWNPALILGLEDRKGKIEAGMDADITILNKDFKVLKTIVNGRIVYSSEN